MRRSVAAVLLLCVLVAPAISGCEGPVVSPTLTVPPTPTPDLPPADTVAFAFLQAWQREDYAAMYSLLSPAAQEAYPETEFTDSGCPRICPTTSGSSIVSCRRQSTDQTRRFPVHQRLTF